MQSSQEIESQINQVQREVQDIENSMARLSRTQDLLDAYSEIRNRIDVVRLLQERLTTAHQNEELEQAERLEIERKRDEIQAEIERLNAEFDTLLAPLESLLSEALPKLFGLARARQSQQSRYSELGRTLRGSPDELGLDRLVHNYGWTIKDEADPTKIRRLLLMLYRDEIKAPGGYNELNRLMPMLQMAQASTPTPQTTRHLDTLGTHLHDLGL
jgi:DNA repair exonuclease SbcCD ATPase subunit